MNKGLIFVVVLLCLAAFSASHQDNASHDPKGRSQPAAETALAAKPPNTQTAAPKSQGKMQWFYVLVSWPDGITALALILTLGAIIWQSSETRRTAQTAAKQTTLMEDTAKRQLRAYITLKQAKVLLKLDGSFEAVIEVTNSGQTPAYDLRGAAKVGFSKYPLPDLGNPPEDIRKSTSIVGAGRGFTSLGSPIKWDNHSLENTLRALTADNFVFYAVGFYRYWDIFKDTEHFIRMQLILGGPSGIKFLPNEDGTMVATLCNDTIGNEAD